MSPFEGAAAAADSLDQEEEATTNPRRSTIKSLRRESRPPSDAPREGYSRARFVIERRDLRCYVRPAARTAPVPLSPMPRVKGWPVFRITPEQIIERSHVLCICPSCGGHETRGELECLTCHGSGRVEAWLAMQISTRIQVMVNGRGAALERHEHVTDPDDFDAGIWENELVHRAYFRSLPPHLGPQLRPSLDECERVIALEVQTFIGSSEPARITVAPPADRHER